MLEASKAACNQATVAGGAAVGVHPVVQEAAEQQQAVTATGKLPEEMPGLQPLLHALFFLGQQELAASYPQRISGARSSHPQLPISRRQALQTCAQLRPSWGPSTGDVVALLNAQAATQLSRGFE